MTMPPDLPALLEPVEGDLAAGPDLRGDYSAQSLYYRLRDARSDARAAERAADADPSLEAEAGQHWKNVAQFARAALEKSRDLEIAAWLTEALVREEGLPGLAEGARLIEALTRRFWDGLYPMPDEDGMETRVAPVAGLNGVGGDGTLMQPLRKLPLFIRSSGLPVPVFLYQQAEETEGLGDAKRKAARLASGVPDFAGLETEARAARAGFTILLRDAAEASAAWKAMGAALDEAAGADAPPTSRVGELLDQIAAIARRYAPADMDEPVSAAEPVRAGIEPFTSTAAPPVARAAQTREDMLRQLGEIAAFFRRTEPQSPIALTLEEAVRRARLSWPDLLAEILPDEGTRQAMLIALGIRPAPPS